MRLIGKGLWVYNMNLDRGGIGVSLASWLVRVEVVHSRQLAPEGFHCSCLTELSALRIAHSMYGRCGLLCS